MPTVDVKEELRELIARNIVLEERVSKLEKNADGVVRECRHFSRQFEMLMHHHEHVDNLVQNHEWELCKHLCRHTESEAEYKNRIIKEYDEVDEDIRG